MLLRLLSLGGPIDNGDSSKSGTKMLSLLLSEGVIGVASMSVFSVSS